MCAGVYAVLGRRRARVVREEMREGSDLFSIHAYLPAQASFGFANDMRRQSSGDKLPCCPDDYRQVTIGLAAVLPIITPYNLDWWCIYSEVRLLLTHSNSDNKDHVLSTCNSYFVFTNSVQSVT